MSSTCQIRVLYFLHGHYISKKKRTGSTFEETRGKLFNDDIFPFSSCNAPTTFQSPVKGFMTSSFPLLCMLDYLIECDWCVATKVHFSMMFSQYKRNLSYKTPMMVQLDYKRFVMECKSVDFLPQPQATETIYP